MKKSFIRFHPILTTIPEEDEEEEVNSNPQTGRVENVGALGQGVTQQQQIGFNKDFLSQNRFDVIEYLDHGKFGTVYSAMANERAIKYYPIDQIPKGGVIRENIWRSGHQLYEERPLQGIKVAIKYIPPSQQPGEDPSEQEDQLLLGAVGGFQGLLSADIPERIGRPLEEDEEMGVYIVMEFLEMTLKQWVEGMKENEVQLDDSSIEIFLQQMIDGLSYLHKNNVTHNDLHSSNVMVTEDEEGAILMKIVDFGQSAYLSEYNSPKADIRGLGLLMRLVMTLHDIQNAEFKTALDDFIYTCVKGVFSNMTEVQNEFQSIQKIGRKEKYMGG